MANNIKKFGPLLFLLFHPFFLISVFVLKFMEIINEHLAILLIGALSLEAIYLASFIWAKLARTANYLREVEKEMADLREDTADMPRMQRELIYAGHQIKTLQMDLDALKKTGSIKLTGNGHRRSHPPAMSHS